MNGQVLDVCPAIVGSREDDRRNDTGTIADISALNREYFEKQKIRVYGKQKFTFENKAT